MRSEHNIKDKIVLSKIFEIKEKIRNYRGQPEGLRKLKIALKRVLECYTHEYIKLPHLAPPQMHAIIETRLECCDLELELEFVNDAANSMHFISSCYIKLEKNHTNLQQACAWICRACTTEPQNPHHKSWRSTVYNEYINFLERQITILTQKSLFKDCVPIYQELINTHEQLENNGKRFNFALNLFDCYIKLIPDPNDGDSYCLNAIDIEDLLTYYLGMANCLVHAKLTHVYLPKKEEALITIQRKEKFLCFQLLRLQKYLQGKLGHPCLADLEYLEKYYLKIIALYQMLHNRESAAIGLATIANYYYLYATQNATLKTEDNVQKMYHYARQAMSTTDQGRPPHELKITEIFELYANYYHNISPHTAVQIYEEALKYSKDYCKDKRTIFFCLKGIAACHLKFAAQRDESLSGISLCQIIADYYRTALTHLENALSFHQQYLDETKVSKSDCLHLLFTAHYELAFYYEYLVHYLNIPVNQDVIEDHYQKALTYATKNRDNRLVGKAQAQLANFYYLHRQFPEAVRYWQMAIENFLQDLRVRARFTSMFEILERRYIVVRETKFENYTVTHAAYHQLLRDIINYGHELNRSMSRARRYEATTFRLDSANNSSITGARDHTTDVRGHDLPDSGARPHKQARRY